MKLNNNLYIIASLKLCLFPDVTKSWIPFRSLWKHSSLRSLKLVFRYSSSVEYFPCFLIIGKSSVVIPKKYNYNHEELFILEQLQKKVNQFSLFHKSVVPGYDNRGLKIWFRVWYWVWEWYFIAVYRLHIITSIAISFHKLHVQRLYLKPTWREQGHWKHHWFKIQNSYSYSVVHKFFVVQSKGP